MADQVVHHQVIRRPLRRPLYIIVWLAALAAPVAAVGYLLYANLLNPRVTQQLTATYDSFYWDAAQLQIAYGRLENQLLLYKAGVDSDYSKIQLRLQVVQSKVGVVTISTRMLGSQKALAQRQQGELDSLDALLDSIGPDVDALQRDPARAAQIIALLRAHWAEVNDLALSRRFADIADREALNRDFIEKRRLLFAAGLVLMLLSTASTALLVLNGRRRTNLIRQQHAALEAEHQASRAAREASLAKDTFLGMISHELRTPLHAIVSSVELLGFNFHSDSDSKVIRRLETAARHLEAQMKDLTDYARLGAGKLELRHEHFDPRELLASIIDEHHVAALAKRLKLDGDAQGVAARVDSDPHRIRQIVNNLVTNAIRYTEKGEVNVRFALDAAHAPAVLSITVRDTGPGVPHAQIPLIFKEFTQLDSSRSRRFEGAGMGLAIVQGLVDLFGGQLEIESRLGEGTTFTISIPVALVELAAPPQAATPAPDDGARPRVLIVDDNELVRESLREMIEHMGCDAAALGSADEAIGWLDTHHCDVVLLDLHMPGRDGYAFIEEFTARSGPAAGAPVIVVSAYAPEQPSDETTAFFDCLAKPVHYEVLREAVQRALTTRMRPDVMRG